MRGKILQIEGLNIGWVYFQYERLPIFCYRCGILGHNEQECPQRKTRLLSTENEDFLYGHGLRAVTLRQKIQGSAQHNLHSHYETPMPNNQEVDDNANVFGGDVE